MTSDTFNVGMLEKLFNIIQLHELTLHFIPVARCAKQQGNNIVIPPDYEIYKALCVAAHEVGHFLQLKDKNFDVVDSSERRLYREIDAWDRADEVAKDCGFYNETYFQVRVACISAYLSIFVKQFKRKFKEIPSLGGEWYSGSFLIL